MTDDSLHWLPDRSAVTFYAKKREWEVSLFSRSPWQLRAVRVQVDATSGPTLGVSKRVGATPLQVFSLRNAMIRVPPASTSALPNMIEVR
jgi:hypothetical protein